MPESSSTGASERNPCRTESSSALVAFAVVTAACGGDGGQQTEVADLFVELAENENIVVDRDCVVDIADGLSDEDATLIVEAGSEGSADISPDAEAIIEQTQNCIDVDSYRASVVAQFEADSSVDTDCLGSELADAASVREINAQAIGAAGACSG